LVHPIYQRVKGATSARTFMEHHVFAVWDFMSLLKALQRRLTCVDVPWIPPVDPRAARLINEIVVAEESDEDGKGSFAGHFDLYLEAMRDVGADTTRIEHFLDALRAGFPLDDALDHARVPESVSSFVKNTVDLALHAETHGIAAAFFLGRENVIPEMFDKLRASLEPSGAPRLTERLRYYLSRHVEVDGDLHGPAAQQLLISLCESDPVRWRSANAAACRALRARIRLWDGVVSELSAGAR
jgi:hypothetical protein